MIIKCKSIKVFFRNRHYILLTIKLCQSLRPHKTFFPRYGLQSLIYSETSLSGHLRIAAIFMGRGILAPFSCRKNSKYRPLLWQFNL